MSKWDSYFMSIADNTANLSKDPRTKVGAVIVKNKKIKSIGYNGAPKSFPDDLVPTDNSGETLKEKKNTYMCHAELNSILNYDGLISDLNGATMYITLSPCSKCACLLAQVGIKKIIYKKKYDKKEETEATDYIFEKCGIEQIHFEC